MCLHFGEAGVVELLFGRRIGLRGVFPTKEFLYIFLMSLVLHRIQTLHLSAEYIEQVLLHQILQIFHHSLSSFLRHLLLRDLIEAYFLLSVCF